MEDADPKWKKGRLGDYVRIQGGFAFKSRDFKETGGIGIIKITNIADGQVDIVNTQFVDTVIVKNLDPNLKLLQGAVLIAMTGAEIGKIGIVENTEKELWLNQRVGIFNEIRRYGKLLAFFALNSDEGQEHILSSATGSAQPNISSTKIEEFEIPILPDLVLNEFGVIVNSLVDKICFNLGQVRTLSNLRDTLLPKLMSGEVMLKHE
ncbi:MAG: HsdS [Parcubacteria group bacterium GW2011_GWF2_44_17]|nr:MAG: HsdS [Parcubacteria group bacterium GW2011_GWF2_44_17]